MRYDCAASCADSRNGVANDQMGGSQIAVVPLGHKRATTSPRLSRTGGMGSSVEWSTAINDVECGARCSMSEDTLEMDLEVDTIVPDHRLLHSPPPSPPMTPSAPLLRKGEQPNLPDTHSAASAAAAARVKDSSGIALAFAGAIAMSFEALLCRLVQERGVAMGPYMFWQALGKGAMQLFGFWVNHGDSMPAEKMIPRTVKGWQCALIGWVGGVTATGLAPYAVGITTASLGYEIFYLYPMFAAIAAAHVLGERMKPITWLAMIVVMLSVCFLIGDALWRAPKTDLIDTATAPGPYHQANVLGVTIMFIAAILFAVYMVATRYVSESEGPERHTPMVVFLGLGMISSAFLIGVPLTVAIDGRLDDNMDMTSCFWMTIQVSLGGAYWFLISIALERTTAARVALISMLDLVTGPAVSAMRYPEPTSFGTICAQLVLVATLLGHEAYRMADDKRERRAEDARQ